MSDTSVTYEPPKTAEQINEELGYAALKQVETYIEDIMSGRIKSCQKTRWAFDRYLNDVKSGRWVLDIAEFGRVIKWSMLFKHSKGVLAGKHIVLEPFQKFIVLNVFGMKDKNGYRRFSKAYIQLARKNAKSQLLAILSSYELFRNQEMAEVYIAGVSKEQSRIVFDEVLYQLNMCEPIKPKWKFAYGKITRFKTQGVIAALSRDTRKTGDGKNPSMNIIDEYHAHPTSEILDVLDSGTGARAEPITVIITTAGFDYNSPCYNVEYKYVSRMAKGEVENDNYFALIYELDEGDNPFDEEVWIKANPIVANYERGLINLRKQAQQAKDINENLRNYLTKNMNIWVDMKDEGYMDMTYLKEQILADDSPIYDDLDTKVIVGIDLSTDTDLTAVSWLRRRKSKPNEYVMFSHAFMPSAKYHERIKVDRVPYDVYVRQGHLTLTEGRTVDYTKVREFIIGLVGKYNVLQICYDKWNATHFMSELHNEGFSVIDVPQNISSLSNPTKLFRKNVYDKHAYIHDNGLLLINISNAVMQTDSNGNIKLHKEKSNGRIDMIAAGINAVAHLHDLPITPRIRTF